MHAFPCDCMAIVTPFNFRCPPRFLAIYIFKAMNKIELNNLKPRTKPRHLSINTTVCEWILFTLQVIK